MIGHNREEATFFDMGRPDTFSLDEAGLKARLDKEYGDWADRILATYRGDRPGATATEIYIAVATARAFGTDTLTLAAMKSLQPAPVYAYRWDYASNWPITNSAATLGAGHATDIGPIFDNWDLPGLHGNGPGVKAAADNLSTLWANFARSGKPTAPGVPDWPRYDTVRRATMLIDATCRVADDPYSAERQLWEGLAG